MRLPLALVALSLAACTPGGHVTPAPPGGGAPDGAPVTPRPDAGPVEFPTAIRAFFIGHSLMSDIPDMVWRFSEASGLGFGFRHQDIPGASLLMQWRDGGNRRFEPSFGGAYTEHLATGEYDHLVLVDSVPRGGEAMVAESIDYATRFVDFALEKNPATRPFLYEPWHCINTGTPTGCAWDNKSPTSRLAWRERLAADLPMWRRIVEEVNRRKSGGAAMRLIPVGSALARLADGLSRGEVPGMRTLQDFFMDDIHLNHYGRYLVACVHHATLYGRSPVGLPTELTDRWGGRSYWNTARGDRPAYPTPSPELVAYLQRTAWAAVTAEPLSGVQGP